MPIHKSLRSAVIGLPFPTNLCSIESEYANENRIYIRHLVCSDKNA